MSFSNVDFVYKISTLFRVDLDFDLWLCSQVRFQMSISMDVSGHWFYMGSHTSTMRLVFSD